VKAIGVVAVVCCLALSVLPAVAAPQQPDAFESLLASAQDAQSRGDFSAAAGFYQKAVSLHPEIAELRANLGLMYYQTKKDDQAIAAFRQALRLKPGLFVPNLFLGLAYVRLNRFSEAIPYFKQAEQANPNDLQVQIGLGQAYAGSGKSRLAVSAYQHAAQLAPGNADAWYHLGVGYLEQVEANARILLTKHKDSAYVQALMAETFAEQRAFIQANDAYKKVLASANYPPEAHAMYGFVLLNQHDLASGERELRAELASNPGSLLAKLGMARVHLEQEGTAEAAKEIGEIWQADPGFLRANASFFNAGLPQEKRSDLLKALHEGRGGDTSAELTSLFSGSARGAQLAKFSGDGATPAKGAARPHESAAVAAPALYAKGNYGACSETLAGRLRSLPAKDLHLLASCAYATGNYRTAFDAAAKLASNTGTEAEGLYWETRSAEKLATESLARASVIDSSSPTLHVLLGDVYRQRQKFPEAEKEYRKALAIHPGDAGAAFGLPLALLAEEKIDEAYRVAQAEMQNHPDDPELNAVMGEILCARNDYYGAEPYLKKSLVSKPELVSHVHALLGKVYAHTDRTQQAIAELKLALPQDKDGSLHYQIGRLYLKIGDREAAQQAFAVVKQMEQTGLTRAAVALKQRADSNEP
jgi:tetratricopeptide (TPR) repeat protein